MTFCQLKWHWRMLSKTERQRRGRTRKKSPKLHLPVPRRLDRAFCSAKKSTVSKCFNGFKGRGSMFKCLWLTFTLAGWPTGLPPDVVEKDERLPRHLGENDFDKKRLDVFALVKAHMSDTVLQQNPLLVLPQTLIPATERFYNGANTTRKTLVGRLNPVPQPVYLDVITTNYPT